MHGYSGRMLHIDLTTGQAAIETFDEALPEGKPEFPEELTRAGTPEALVAGVLRVETHAQHRGQPHSGAE